MEFREVWKDEIPGQGLVVSAKVTLRYAAGGRLICPSSFLQNSGAREGHPSSFSPQPSSLHPSFSGAQADSSHGAGGNSCPKSPGVQQKVGTWEEV